MYINVCVVMIVPYCVQRDVKAGTQHQQNKVIKSFVLALNLNAISPT